MKKLSTDDRIRFAERRQKIEYELYRLWNEDAEIRRDELLLSENGVSIEDATNEQINDATARTRKKKTHPTIEIIGSFVGLLALLDVLMFMVAGFVGIEEATQEAPLMWINHTSLALFAYMWWRARLDPPTTLIKFVKQYSKG